MTPTQLKTALLILRTLRERLGEVFTEFEPLVHEIFAEMPLNDLVQYDNRLLEAIWWLNSAILHLAQKESEGRQDEGIAEPMSTMAQKTTETARKATNDPQSNTEEA